MVPDPISQPEFIGLSSPADRGDLNLALFLFNISENGDQRQTQMINRGDQQMQYPPMTVDLSFLLTAYSTAELKSRALDEQRMLGRAMQVMYDHSILRNPHLQGTLAENNEELRIVMSEPSLDVMINFFPDMPYKLSVAYVVGPVHIDSTRLKTTKRVLERNVHIQG